MNRADLGHMGEAVAAKYYIRQGYLLLNHNYRTRMGELDLILYKANTIVFAEVKTRTSAQRAAPAEAVDYYKQQRLIAAAGQYLQQSPYADANIRFDVVEVLPAGSGWQVHCIRDAFASELCGANFELFWIQQNRMCNLFLLCQKKQAFLCGKV